MRLSRRSRWLIFALMYLAFCAVGGIFLADGALHPARRDLTQGETAWFRQRVQARGAGMEDVSITTPDAVVLRGWLVRPTRPNGDAVVLLHGLGDNRLGMSGYAQLLLAHGYTVLMPDARAHGVSGGPLATYGLLERYDIHQWVDYISAKIGPGCLYGMGESMGAAQLLESLETGTGFCAVVAESSFANFREIAYDRMGQPFHLGPWVGRTVLRPVVEAAFLRAWWRDKLSMQQVSPEDAVRKVHIPVLLIHGLIDSNIPVWHSRRIHERAPKTVLWEVPGADHCGAIAVAPTEFENRVIEWMTQRPQRIRAATGR
jgi:pimeloyl-ACP methyl ester carboxylesterase